jgi:hypothetical protein
MDFNIKNKSVAENVDGCIDEFQKIESIIRGIGVMSHPVPYLTRYSIIKACGTIEYGFKTIISDFSLDAQSEQLKNFVDKKFRNSSMNPSYENICGGLASFDDNWRVKFKEKVKLMPNKHKVLDSLESLNNARNSFAHGGSPTTSFENVQAYFEDSLKVLELIEETISS